MDYMQFAEGDLKFGLSFLAQYKDGNVPMSPTNIRTALAMIYEGAEGESAKQIARVAHLPEDAASRHEGFKRLISALNAADSAQCISRCANGLWVSTRYPINEGYQAAVRDNYAAEVSPADFEGNPDGERAKINGWIGGKTEQKIPSLLPEGSVDALTNLVLASALYFKAKWDNQFDPQYTHKHHFLLPSGETVEVDMMRKGRIDTRGELPKFQYGNFDGIEVARIPYKGMRLAKMIMLPPKGSTVQDLEEQLRAGKIPSTALMMLDSKKFARLEIPKHEVRRNFGLVEPLKAMGIDRIFSLDTAELKGITPRPLYFSAGVHETYFKTDEEGSEGAAATGFVAKTLSFDPAGPVEFVVDRPFLEAVVDTKTGAFLFLNRIEDPR